MTDKVEERSPEEVESERLKRKKKARRRKTWRIIDRIFGFFLATGIVCGLAGLGLEYVLIKGPSPALRDTFVATMLETRRFRFIPNIFLTEEEVQAIENSRVVHVDGAQDLSLITLPSEDSLAGNGADAYGVIDEDGDGIILENIMGPGYVGYLITVLDPTRCFVGMPNGYGGTGLTLGEMCEKYDALGGINAGGFVDPDGGGLGGLPQGLTIIDGVCYNQGYGGEAFAGFDDKGVLHIGYYTLEDTQNLNIVSGVSFGPILIYNGESTITGGESEGVQPRTAIGQRGDGAILMLVIDGRQVHSIGAKNTDVINIMLDHGAVNAINMDGGSSTTMWYEGDYVNKCSSANGLARPLPNAFLFK